MEGLPKTSDIPFAWVRQELSLLKTLECNNRGKAVGRVQEWLCFHGYNLDIDRDFGPVTQDAIRQFQADRGLPRSGKVTQAVFRELTVPLLRALRPVQGADGSLEELAVAYAEHHLTEHPVEVGGDNLGPWVSV